MYIHIKKDGLFSLRDVFGILDLNKVGKKLIEDNFVEKDTQIYENCKTIILIDNNGKLEKFFSKANINTIKSRIKKSKNNILEIKD